MNKQTQMSKQTSVAEQVLGSGVFKLLIAICLLFLLIGLISYVKTRKSDNLLIPGINGCGSSDELRLPRRAGCWTIQLNPNRFSRKVCFPDGVNWRLEWEKNTPALIRNGFGKVIPRNRPQTQRYDHGNHAGNKVLQFKGQGWVKIYLTPRS